MELTLRSDEHAQAIEITDTVNEALGDLTAQPDGVNIWVPHTTAGVTVNEANDPTVMSDLIGQLDKVVPWEAGYDHAEGNAAAHIKSILLGSHQWIPVVDNRLDLGRWQGLFLVEWDGPRKRTVKIRPDG